MDFKQILASVKNKATVIAASAKIYEEAKKRIKFLKTQKFTEKIIINKHQYNYQVTSQGFIQSKNLYKIPNIHSLKGPNKDNSLTLKPTSLLPISPVPIEIV